MAGTRRCAVRALERRVRVLTWERRTALAGLRAERAGVERVRAARRREEVEGSCMVRVRCWGGRRGCDVRIRTIVEAVGLAI
jgi:hypothetical protein